MATAAVVVVTQPINKTVGRTQFREYRFAWTATDGGAIAAGATGNLSEIVFGVIDHIVTIPGESVSSYTIALVDSDGATLATKATASTTATETTSSGLVCPHKALHLVVSGAGDAKTGVLLVRVRNEM
jgi:hypothetical protein